MPVDYKKYPPNWKTKIRPDILERDRHCCKHCGVPNYSVGSWIDNGFVSTCGNYHHDKAGRGELSYKEAKALVDHCNSISDEDKLVVVVLTIMHLDHDTTNNDYSNLAAACQKCHLNHDKDLHKANSKATREKKKGLQNLF